VLNSCFANLRAAADSDADVADYILFALSVLLQPGSAEPVVSQTCVQLQMQMPMR